MGMAPHTRKTYTAGDEPMNEEDRSTEALRRVRAERRRGPSGRNPALDVARRQGLPVTLMIPSGFIYRLCPAPKASESFEGYIRSILWPYRAAHYPPDGRTP